MIDSLVILVGATTLLLGTPGPAPLALSASSAIYGPAKTIPFLLGILTGLGLVVAGSAMGLSIAIETNPLAKTSLQAIGALYIVYLAIKLATSPVVSSKADSQSKPSFLDGFILNISNPKAYAAIFAVFTQFALPYQNQTASVVVTGLICMLVAALVNSSWLLLGSMLSGLFSHPRYCYFIKGSFAILMLSTVIFTLLKS